MVEIFASLALAEGVVPTVTTSTSTTAAHSPTEASPLGATVVTPEFTG